MNYMETNQYIHAIQSLSGHKLYIAGAGKYGEILGKYFDKRKISWQAYIDKRTALSSLNQKPVYSYDKVITDGYYVVSTYLYRKEITEELKQHGIQDNHIIAYESQHIFYDLYNDLIDLKKYAEKVKTFHNKHLGERCFLIGNGPSLKIEDLEKLKKEFIFASNSIYALYPYTNWRPTYYCAGDPIFCKEMMSEKENLLKIIDGCKAAFTSIVGEGIGYRDDSDLKNLHYLYRLNEKCDNGYPKFSTDCSKQTYISGSITYDMLQLAVYMGFRQIYLLGMDFNYSVERHSDNTITKTNIINHMEKIEQVEKRFYKALSERHNATYIADIDLQLAGYKSAKQYADSHGIEIYNATRGGKLEVFPRVDFDDLFH